MVLHFLQTAVCFQNAQLYSNEFAVIYGIERNPFILKIFTSLSTLFNTYTTSICSDVLEKNGEYDTMITFKLHDSVCKIHVHSNT